MEKSINMKLPRGLRLCNPGNIRINDDLSLLGLTSP